VFSRVWSCWADLNRRPHPYQAIFAGFYNNFRLFSVVFIPNNIVSRTFLKRRLRCFHACLWWNCGQTAIPVCWTVCRKPLSSSAAVNSTGSISWLMERVSFHSSDTASFIFQMVSKKKSRTNTAVQQKRFGL